jgi:hypothetical protein
MDMVGHAKKLADPPLNGILPGVSKRMNRSIIVQDRTPILDGCCAKQHRWRIESFDRRRVRRISSLGPPVHSGVVLHHKASPFFP